MTRVAFLGLGAIGAPMAKHLAQPPFELAVWNRTASKARAFAFSVGTGVRVAKSPADAARGAEFVVICLPTSQDVDTLLDGAEGLLAGIAPGSMVIDCTSGDPPTSRTIAARLAAIGAGYIDAPVSGGTSGAEKGTLTVMCGGDEALFERALPVLRAFGEKIVLCGPTGSGDAVKSVNNALLAVHVWAAAEGLAALTKAGVSPALALDVINASSGSSRTTERLFPERVLSRAYPRTFRLALLDKDVGIAAGVARENKVPSPLLQLTSELFRAAHAMLGEEADHVEAVRLIEQWAGVEIK
jgi:3-hydroxyisobutyrate dehydrogenase